MSLPERLVLSAEAAAAVLAGVAAAALGAFAAGVVGVFSVDSASGALRLVPREGGTSVAEAPNETIVELNVAF